MVVQLSTGLTETELIAHNPQKKDDNQIANNAIIPTRSFCLKLSIIINPL